MNTNTLKRFAREARLKLREQVSRKMEFVLSNPSQSFKDTYATQIASLKNKMEQAGNEQVVEMVAYTWFNRLMALRFMDANGYTLPKVVTPLAGMTNPEILQNALGGTIEVELKIDQKRINDLLDGKTAAANAHTEAYKMLLVAACNQWHTAMPFMFERISDYTELLLPDDLLSDYSIVADIRNGMTDEDCQQEELIGWLYQFYIADKKDEVFDGLKKNIKITAENIPAATQLFTPRWIVRYMVENTLGKLWLTFKPNSQLRRHMPYYIEAPEGNTPAPMPDSIKGITDITFLDPCQGSGHVLVYAFDLFTKIYEEEGYNTNDIPALILQHNLFGIDIDERAAQLAAFALSMKARNYYSRFLRKPVQPHLIALANIHEEAIQQAVTLPLIVKGKKIDRHTDLSLHLVTQANNLGSLIQISTEELNAIQVHTGSIWQEQEQTLKLQAEFLGKQYHCVVTNPPYLGNGGMNPEMSNYVDGKYQNSKTDLYCCFIERCLDFTTTNGVSSLINQHGWMFLTSFVDLRKNLLKNSTLVSALHLGPRTFPEISGEIVQNVAFVLHKSNPNESDLTSFFRLVKLKNTESKRSHFISALNQVNPLLYHISQNFFLTLPGYGFGYWLKSNIVSLLNQDEKISSYFYSDGKNVTGSNEKYIKFHWEVSRGKVDKSIKWFLLAKGGTGRKWHGNVENVIDWSITSRAHYRKSKIGRIIPEYLWTKPGITWSKISSGLPTFRHRAADVTFDEVQITTDDLGLIVPTLAILNSKFTADVLEFFNPTLSIQIKDILNVPINMQVISCDLKLLEAVDKNSKTALIDWDRREESFNFNQSLIPISNSLLQEQYDQIEAQSQQLLYDWFLNDKIINAQIHLALYGKVDEHFSLLRDDITIFDDIIEIDEKVEQILEPQNLKYTFSFLKVTSQIISYFVGCMFGRYSQNKPGLILANQGDTLLDYLKQIPTPSFMPDDDNIIPVLDGEWFADDIVGRFKAFLNTAFGDEHFEENLRFIEDTLGKDIRKYFTKDFYNDHIKRYKKRPIYWMFTSTKGHFKVLIYMHRYQPDLCSKLLNDYLQAYISKLDAARQTQKMLSIREDISAREKTAAIKEIDKLDTMLKDCRDYEKTLFIVATQKISIDLDDGVKVNYQKFKDVLVPIKGLEKEED